MNSRILGTLAAVGLIAGAMPVGVAAPTSTRPRRAKRKSPTPPPKQSARELFAMAAAAREGNPPAASPAARMIREALNTGQFSRVRELRAEVKERAAELERIARAQAKRERRRGQ